MNATKLRENINYLKIGGSHELCGKDRLIYKSLEILPGFLAWSTIFAVIFLSWLKPVWIAIFIITFDIYWLVKTIFLSLHLRADWKKMKENLKTDWGKKLNDLFVGATLTDNKGDNNNNTEISDWKNLWQLIILPLYKENFEVVSECVESLLKSDWPKKKMIIFLTYEERAGKEAKDTADLIQKKCKNKFGYFFTTCHPKDLPGEIQGKGSNISWAGKKAGEIIGELNIDCQNILVSAFDIDTIVNNQYFLVLTYNFLTAKEPYNSSYQPVPLYNNNIWYVPFFSRVIATSGTFWQMMQQERPERLATFSSHSMTFKTLKEIGFWQTNMVSEDSRIFWNCFLFYDGNYKVIPLTYPVSMDANLGENFWQTVKNVYRQQRRWSWGVENVPYILFGFIKNKKISVWKKLRFSFMQIEGFWSLATNPLLIFLLGWLPLIIGGQEFNNTILSYNLPRMTRNLMNIAMLGLIGSAIISTSLLPPRPKNIKRKKYFSMILQWIFIPFTIIFFGAIPGLETQTRLMFGGRFRLGFWVTPKNRKNS